MSDIICVSTVWEQTISGTRHATQMCTYLHDIDPVRDVVELAIRTTRAAVEDEGVQVVPQTERDVERRKHRHERRDDDHGPVDRAPQALVVPEQAARAQAERDEVDAVRDALHEQRDDLRFVDREVRHGGGRVAGGWAGRKRGRVRVRGGTRGAGAGQKNDQVCIQKRAPPRVRYIARKLRRRRKPRREQCLIVA